MHFPTSSKTSFLLLKPFTTFLLGPRLPASARPCRFGLFVSRMVSLLFFADSRGALTALWVLHLGLLASGLYCDLIAWCLWPAWLQTRVVIWNLVSLEAEAY